MAHIFVAYHHADADFAFTVQQQLEAAGFTAWINPMPEAGTNWYPWIEAGLRESFAVIPVITPTARAAEVVTYEWSYAVGAGFTVIPLIAAPTDLHPRLAALTPLDFTESQPWDDLLARVYEQAAILSRAAIPVPDDAPPAVQKMIAALHAPQDRGPAVTTLAAFGHKHPAALAALIAAVTHPIYADVRRAAAERLGQIGGSNALAALLVALCDPDDSVSHAAAQALTRFGDDAVPGLAEVMHSDNRMGKRTAVWVLSRIGTPATAPALIEALVMPGWFGSRTAAATLGKLRDPRAVPALIAALTSDDESLVRLAVAALESIGTPNALAALAEAEAQREKA